MPKRLTSRERWLRSVKEEGRGGWREQVLEILTTNGWIVYHTFGAEHFAKVSAKGFLDVVAYHPRRRDLFVAELKRETTSPTPQQLQWLAAFEAKGIDAYVWRPRDVDAVVARATRRPR